MTTKNGVGKDATIAEERKKTREEKFDVVYL
jgi:hypothetical protein